MKIRKASKIMGLVLLLAAACFAAGRYGWRLWGFAACQSAGIETVEVSESAVHITGFYPGSFPSGFCGYYAQERDGALYVGFRFGDIAGFFETGDFDIMIPVKGDISRVVMKSSQAETELWNRDAGFVPQSEQYGVFVRLEQNDVYAVTMSYEGFSGGPACPDGMAWESGQFLFMDNDIMMVAKDTGAPVPFIVTVRGADGTVLAEGNFQFEVEQEKLFLTFTADGKIEETYAAP